MSCLIEPHEYEYKIGHGTQRQQMLTMLKLGVKLFKKRLEIAIGAERIVLEGRLDKVHHLVESGFLTDAENEDLKSVIEYGKLGTRFNK